jgi:hypothetical protein
MTMRWSAGVLALGLSGSVLVSSPPPANAEVRAASVAAPADDHSIVDAEAAPLPSVMADTERGAVRVVDGFWKRHFRDLSNRRYKSPTVKGGYRGANGPRCAGRASVAFNAFYCRPGDFLAWDEKLMSVGYEKIGDSWVYLIIAHEWGHAIQDRVKLRPGRYGVELQADCLAGATLQGAANDGLVRVDKGDAEELQRTLAAAADDFPWTNEGDHGNAEQRIGAFRDGAQRGLSACF